MPRFHFRLDALLESRRGTHRQRQLALTEARRQRDELASEQSALVARRNQCRDAARDLLRPGTLDLASLQLGCDCEATIATRLGTLQERLDTADALLSTLRAELMEAHREVRVLEKLRERQRQQFQLEQSRADVKQLDEIAGRTPRRDR